MQTMSAGEKMDKYLEDYEVGRTYELGEFTLTEVLSDECELVSVDRKFQEFMQHRVAATQQEQLHVEPYM